MIEDKQDDEFYNVGPDFLTKKEYTPEERAILDQMVFDVIGWDPYFKEHPLPTPMQSDRVVEPQVDYQQPQQNMQPEFSAQEIELEQ